MPPADGAAAPTGPGRALARIADRCLPGVIALLLVSLLTSITAAGVLTALAIAAALLRLLDPELRGAAPAPLALPLAVFAAVTLLSALLAPEPGHAFVHSKHLLSMPLFLAAVHAFRTPAQVTRAFAWLFAAAAVVAGYALVQTWACSTTRELAPAVGWALKVDLERCRQLVPFRAKAFHSIYMTLGGVLVVVLALLLALLPAPGRRRAALAAVGALALPVLGLTYARNAWVGLAAAVLTLLGLTRRVTLAVPLAAAALLAVAVPSPLQTRLASMVDPADATARERLYMWDAGVRMLADAPLLGQGPGGVKRRYVEFRHPDAAKPRTGHLHNNVAQIAAERGLLGLAAWLWIWVAFFRRALRIHGLLAPTRGDGPALVAGSIAAVTGFLVAGLFEYNFGDAEVIDLVWIVMAVPFVCAAHGRAHAGATARAG